MSFGVFYNHYLLCILYAEVRNNKRKDIKFKKFKEWHRNETHKFMN